MEKEKVYSYYAGQTMGNYAALLKKSIDSTKGKEKKRLKKIAKNWTEGYYNPLKNI
jgi:hypothetical protein